MPHMITQIKVLVLFNNYLLKQEDQNCYRTGKCVLPIDMCGRNVCDMHQTKVSLYILCSLYIIYVEKACNVTRIQKSAPEC